MSIAWNSLTKIMLVMMLVLASCGGEANAGNTKIDTSEPVIVGVNPGLHAVIMENVRKIAEKKRFEN